MKKRRASILMLSAFAFMWLLVVGAGFKLLLNYSFVQGPDGDSPVEWPVGSHMGYDHDRPTLIVFAHPQCPCTRATIGELAVLMASHQDRVTAHVLLLRSENVETDWTRSGLWESAAAIPGVSVRLDHDGTEAQRFRAGTSGHTVLYDQNGLLVFHGGITGSRGHSGDNAGRDAVTALLTNGYISGERNPGVWLFTH